MSSASPTGSVAVFDMSRPGFFFCFCPDSQLLQKRLTALLAKQEGQWQRKSFWADEPLPEKAWEELTLTTLFGEKRAVVFRHAEAFQAEDWKKFTPLLRSFNPQVWPIFCLEHEWKRSSPSIPAGLQKRPFWKLAQKNQWVWQSPGLTPQTLPDYLRRWAQARNLTLSQTVEQKALTRLPLDVAALDNELAKLELLARENHNALRLEDLEVVTHEPDLDIFTFMTALQQGNNALEVWRTVFYNRLGADSGMIFPFLGLLVREARILWQLLFGPADNVSLPPGIKRQKTALARDLGGRRLAQIWSLALEAEVGIKSGERSPDQALETLLTSLMRLFHR